MSKRVNNRKGRIGSKHESNRRSYKNKPILWKFVCRTTPGNAMFIDKRRPFIAKVFKVIDTGAAHFHAMELQARLGAH